MKKLLISTALTLAMALPATAQQAQKMREISTPIVAFTPVIAKNADALNLTEDQRVILKDWLATMPAKRKALEAETVSARAELRSAIIQGAPQDERQALAEKVGEMETKLVMMRSACTDHWRGVLSADQFAQMLDIAAK